jgi:cytochrome d ubiquinol oxidase subunit II
MQTLWFWLVAIMICGYVVFDGFDLGAGLLHLVLARTDQERRLVLKTIGPVWDGNEVWLLAAGGTLYFAFPGLYASGFSGFYLPLMMVLWLLVLRGISIEFRNHLEGPLWPPFWDVVFCVASGLLALFLGVALGNVVRGVPLNADGWFFEPLWTNFSTRGNTGILDWYTVIVGVAAVVSLALHGALWVWLKTDGPVAERARRLAHRAWPIVLVMIAAVTAVTWVVQPVVPEHLAARPWGYVLPALAIVGVGGVVRGIIADRPRTAFLSSAVYLVGMLASAAFGLYPYVLPSSTDPAYGLTAQSVAAPIDGLQLGLVWWIPGMLIAAGYFVYVYRHFGGKAEVEGEGY